MNVIVGVGYDADPAVVEKTLRDVATADERVTKDPAPVVRFQGFGESSLDFQLFAWTELTGDRWRSAGRNPRSLPQGGHRDPLRAA